MSFDMNKMLKEAQRMQEELAKVQEEAATEVVQASAGGGMVTVKANGAGEVVSITIEGRVVVGSSTSPSIWRKKASCSCALTPSRVCATKLRNGTGSASSCARPVRIRPISS